MPLMLMVMSRMKNSKAILEGLLLVLALLMVGTGVESRAVSVGEDDARWTRFTNIETPLKFINNVSRRRTHVGVEFG